MINLEAYKSRIQELEQQAEQDKAEIATLRATVAQQANLINSMAAEIERIETILTMRYQNTVPIGWNTCHL
jgi:uncharacterized coiled-coil protein SlyX